MWYPCPLRSDHESAGADRARLRESLIPKDQDWLFGGHGNGKN